MKTALPGLLEVPRHSESNKGLLGFTTYVITNDALIFFAKVFITKLFIVT
jgi:hypothetical protein